jgi:arylsulfatase A-like enzyme
MSSIWTSRPPEECSTPRRGLSRAPGAPRTLAEWLSARGARSAGFVASARAGRGYGMDRGFSEFHEVLTGGIGRAEALREAVERWLQTAGPAPFFLYAHFREPHFPYDPPPPFDQRFGPAASLPQAARRDQGWIDSVNTGRTALEAGGLEELVRLYDGNLAYTDREVGALRRALQARGLWDRTVFIVTADHGEALREHGFIGHNRQVHDESARIPLVVRFPGRGAPAGIRVATLASSLDLAPTVAEIFGADAGAPGFTGTSLLALAAGAAGRGFAVTGSATGARPTYAIRDGRFTLIRSLRHTQERLFDAVQDPRETNDLAQRQPLEAAHARSQLFRWLASLRRGPAEEPGAVTLTPEQRAQVRALGYVE